MVALLLKGERQDSNRRRVKQRNMSRSNLTEDRFRTSYKLHPELYASFADVQDKDGLILRELQQLTCWQGKVVVDLGCGHAPITRHLIPSTRAFIGIDPSLPLLRMIPVCHHLYRIAGVTERLPIADHSADVVLSLWGDFKMVVSRILWKR